MSARHYVQDIPDDDPSEDVPVRQVRSIRDFKPSAERRKLSAPARIHDDSTLLQHTQPRRPRRRGIWIAAALALVVLLGAAALLLLPKTTIAIVPRTHVMPFDASGPLTAFPATTAATGTIRYTVVTEVFEDSAIVAASGTEKAEEKATGTVTIYNESNEVMRLIKNTRFESSDGLIFRIPASVEVPALKGTAAGSIQAAVFADQVGPKYNLAAGTKFTLPGLKGTELSAKIYGKSAQAFSGGFSGTRPAVSASVLDAAKAEVRSRLNEKAQQSVKNMAEGSIAFPGLIAISYETLAPTEESGGSVRIHEKATITLPIFSEDALARSLAQAVSADAEGQSVKIRFSDDIAATPVGELLAGDIGVEPLVFTLAGRGQLVWVVDGNALSMALSGREESAFKPIIDGFLAIEGATARITPFWRHSFPADPADIVVTIEDPAETF